MAFKTNFTQLASFMQTFGPEARSQFHQFDLDGDGQLNRVEFLSASMSPAQLSILFAEGGGSGGRYSFEQLSETLGANALDANTISNIFKTLNLNGDGAVSKTELLQLTQAELKLELLYNKTLGNSTSMTLEQAVGLFELEGMSREQIVELIFKLDKDQDGILSWPEFCQYAKIPVVPVPKILAISN